MEPIIENFEKKKLKKKQEGCLLESVRKRETDSNSCPFVRNRHKRVFLKTCKKERETLKKYKDLKLKSVEIEMVSHSLLKRERERDRRERDGRKRNDTEKNKLLNL